MSENNVTVVVPVTPTNNRRKKVTLKQNAEDLVTPIDTSKAKKNNKVKSTSNYSVIDVITEDVTEDHEFHNIDNDIDHDLKDVAVEVLSPKIFLKVNKNVMDVYKIVRNVTGAIGGNGYNGAIYGELTTRSMQRVLNILIDKCQLSSSSRFIDVGSGLGKPNFHAAQDPRVRLSIGVELEEIRWQLSMHNLNRFLTLFDDIPKNTKGPNKSKSSSSSNSSSADLSSRLNGGVNFILADIDTATSLDPFTHIYMFDLGFPPPLQKSIADKFNQSVHPTCLVSYRPPRRVIHEYGYKVEFVDQVLCSMHGSGEGHTAYIYRRLSSSDADAAAAAANRKVSNQKSLKIPGRVEMNEEDVEVACDAAFYEASKLATEGVSQLKAYTKSVVADHMDAGRPKRDRKPRVISDPSTY